MLEECRQIGSAARADGSGRRVRSAEAALKENNIGQIAAGHDRRQLGVVILTRRRDVELYICVELLIDLLPRGILLEWCRRNVSTNTPLLREDRDVAAQTGRRLGPRFGIARRVIAESILILWTSARKIGLR